MSNASIIIITSAIEGGARERSLQFERRSSYFDSMSAVALFLVLVVVSLVALLAESFVVVVVVVPPSAAATNSHQHRRRQSKVLSSMSSSLGNDEGLFVNVDHSSGISSGGQGRKSDGDVIIDGAMHGTYNDLACRVIERYNGEYRTLRNAQLFIGIAGGPGSGKSTLATAVAEIINQRMGPTPDQSQREQQQQGAGGEGSSGAAATAIPAAVVLPMDGFHYSRSQLRTMSNSNISVHHTYDELLARRGAPWTFDADGCIDAFTSARRNGYADLPIYCRTRSDPIRNGAQLHARAKIILLEGNYLLSYNDERWKPLRTNNIFDETWYITCPSINEQRERLIRRHLQTWTDEKTISFGASGKVGAGIKADLNDMKNLIWIEEMGSRMYADYIIESI